MKTLRKFLLIAFGILFIGLVLIIGVYFHKFSSGISEDPSNWDLFISICNWAFISILTGLNVWVFFKLTTLISQNDNNRFIEDKVSRSENAILELRINDYKSLREQAINLKLAILRDNDLDSEFKAFMKVLLSMQNSRLFATTDNKGSVLDEVVKYINEASKSHNSNDEKLIYQIDSVLRTLEILIFSQQLRDDRILNEIRKYPNRFDATLVGIDNLVKKYDKPC